APTAAFNMDVSGFFAKWLGDVAADQLPNGAVPFVVPNVLAKMWPDAAGSTGWADVATIAPGTMFRGSADTALPRRQQPARRAAFQREFLTQSGRITSSTQTAYVMALDFDLVPDSLRAKAAGHLADDVKRMGHLTTGFLGTPALTRMLSDNGYLKEAYALLLR